MSEMSRHDKRWENGIITTFGLGFVAAVGYGIHWAFGLWTFAKVLGLAVGGVVGVLLLIYVVGCLVTDVPEMAARWLR